MRVLQISKFKFERHLDNPRRLYVQNLSNGLDHSNRFKHRKVLWIGLWFFEIQINLFSKPN